MRHDETETDNYLLEYRRRQLRTLDQPFHSGGSDRWGDRAGSCEKYGAFAGASGAESEGDAAEDVEYESKNGIRSDLCIQAEAKMGEY